MTMDQEVECVLPVFAIEIVRCPTGPLVNASPRYEFIDTVIADPVISVIVSGNHLGMTDRTAGKSILNGSMAHRDAILC